MPPKLTSKRNRHHKKSQQTAVQAVEREQKLFELWKAALLLMREKRVLLFPLLERQAVCGNYGSTEERCLQLVSKEP